MARTVVRGTPITSVKAGNSEGQAAGMPRGSDGKTTMQQYRGTGFDTTQSDGTPYHSQRGNGPETRRVESHDRYGRVIDAVAGDQANNLSNGTGVLFNGTDSMDRGYSAPDKPYEDSPVPRHAAVFDPAFMVAENAEHLGHGSGPTAPNGAMARDDLMQIGGVMSRGMVGTSTPQGSEFELTEDDTLPSTPPAGRT